MHPSFALVDLKIAKKSGLQLIQPLKAIRADMRGYASVATAVEAIKLGADNYLPNPVTIDAILRTLADEEPPALAEEEATMTPLSRL